MTRRFDTAVAEDDPDVYLRNYARDGYVYFERERTGLEQTGDSLLSVLRAHRLGYSRTYITQVLLSSSLCATIVYLGGSQETCHRRPIRK